MKRRQEAAEEAERKKLQAEAGNCGTFHLSIPHSLKRIFFLDLRMKEEAANRQAEDRTRDQADAGTPREEAGKSHFCLVLLQSRFEL